MAAGAQTILEGEVRELVRQRGIDPIAEPAVVRRLVEEVVGHYRDRAITAALPPLGDVAAASQLVHDAVAGFGPLQPLLDDPSVEEIWINEPGRVFLARHGRSELTTLILGADQVADLVERMLRPTGRRIDLSTPFVDAMLPDGSRLHVVIPNITLQWFLQGFDDGRSASATRGREIVSCTVVAVDGSLGRPVIRVPRCSQRRAAAVS